MTDAADILSYPLPARAEEPADMAWGHFASPTSGAKIRYAHAPLPGGMQPKGTVVLLPGFREPIEKYFETIRDLHDRGYAVWMMDWRGQGGSDRYLPLFPHMVHSLGYDEQVAILDCFMKTKVLPGRVAGQPLHLMAHSMGSHITLRYLHDHNQPDAAGNRGPVDSAMLSDPMADINTGNTPRLLAFFLAALAKTANKLEQYIPMGGDWRISPLVDCLPGGHRQGYSINPETSNLTSDPVRIMTMPVWFARKPELALGDPTLGWLYHTMVSIAKLMRPAYLKAIKTPILIGLAGHGKVVVPQATRRLAGLLPNCTLHELPDAKHELFMEHDRVRKRWLAAIDDFLAARAAPALTSKPGPKSTP